MEQLESFSDSDENVFVSDMEDNEPVSQSHQPTLFIKDSFKIISTDLGEASDMLTLLSGQFSFATDRIDQSIKMDLESHVKPISQSDVIGLLSGQFDMPQGTLIGNKSR
jgi:hypothetical protein